MRALVAEGAAAAPAEPIAGRPFLMVGPATDDAVEALDAAGPAALVLARAGTPLAQVGRIRGADVVALPAEGSAARWVVAVARRAPDDAGLVRRLEALSSAAACGALPVTAARPAAILRWAGLAWRSCDQCGGGRVPAGPCGRCGAPARRVAL